jgi:glycosyltransferase involved in cell wall biosynthesis
MGTTRARNEGARSSRSRWLLFLDDDLRPALNYLPTLESFLRKNSWADAEPVRPTTTVTPMIGNGFLIELSTGSKIHIVMTTEVAN